MASISQSDLEARLGRSLTGEEVTAFTIINDANQAWVEKQIGSEVESVSATDRYYDGGVQHLSIAPCTGFVSLKTVDDDLTVIETVDTTDYQVEPTSKTIKTMIRYRPGKFPRGINNLVVNAKFSIFDDTDTLNIVKNALLEALLAEFKGTENIKRKSIEGYSVEFATTEVKDALSPIKTLFPNII